MLVTACTGQSLPTGLFFNPVNGNDPCLLYQKGQGGGKGQGPWCDSRQRLLPGSPAPSTMEYICVRDTETGSEAQKSLKNHMLSAHSPKRNTWKVLQEVLPEGKQ